MYFLRLFFISAVFRTHRCQKLPVAVS